MGRHPAAYGRAALIVVRAQFMRARDLRGPRLIGDRPTLRTGSTLEGDSAPAVAPWPEVMIEVLERQHSLLDQLEGLSESQSVFIAEKRTDRLLALLSRRQALIDDLTGCQVEMTALSHTVDRPCSVSRPTQERLTTLVGSVSGRLRELMRRDRRDEAALHAGQTVPEPHSSFAASHSSSDVSLDRPPTRSNCL